MARMDSQTQDDKLNQSSDQLQIELRATQESDRTYIARLNFLTDTFGDEFGEISEHFDKDYEYYVAAWNPNEGGFIAWDAYVPAGGVWLMWGTEESHGFGHAEEGIPELALAVEGRYKGQGIGTSLIQAATELARKLGTPGISLAVDPDNPRAHRLYQYLGFEHEGERNGHLVLVKRFTD